MVSNVRLLLEIVRFDLARLIGMCVVVALALGSLGWFYPAQRELDTAEYQYATWDVSTPVEVFAEDVEQVQQDFGAQNVFLAAYWTTSLSKDGIETPSDVQITLTPDTASTLGFFPRATLISVSDVGDAWMDVDVAIAKALHAHSGDEITLAIGDESVAYRVRGVYAVSPVLGFNPSVVASATPVMQAFTGHIPGSDGERGVMNVAHIRGMSVEDVERVFSNDFYQSRFEQGGYDPDNLGMTTRVDELNYAGANSAASLGLIGGVSIVATLALLGLVIRETWAFSKSAAKKAGPLVVIGYGKRRLAWLIGWVCCLGVGLALTAGSAAALQMLNSGVLVAVFPPSLLGTFWALCLAFWAVLAGLCGVVSWYALIHNDKRS